MPGLPCQKAWTNGKDEAQIFQGRMSFLGHKAALGSQQEFRVLDLFGGANGGAAASCRVSVYQADD